MQQSKWLLRVRMTAALSCHALADDAGRRASAVPFHLAQLFRFFPLARLLHLYPALIERLPVFQGLSLFSSVALRFPGFAFSSPVSESNFIGQKGGEMARD